MADYHPLISRAVAGLDKNTGENRRVLYERARAALVNQLRSIEPALDESDITRERLALEEAIRKVEADAAKRTRDDEISSTRPESRPSSLTDQGLRGFRESVMEAEGIGGAAAEAHRSAREVYEAVPGEHARKSAEDVHYFEPPGSEPPPPVSEPELMDEAPPPHPRARGHELPEGALPQSYEDETFTRPARSWGGLIKLVLLLLVIGGLAGAGYWQRQSISTLIANFRSSPSKPQQAGAPPSRPKISDRVGNAPGGSKTATVPAAAVAQKVVLYEEDPNNPQGVRYVGSAIWRTETVSPGPGLAPELAVRADVDIPERHMRMTWSLRRNTDKALPASHTIEVQFSLPADFVEGGIGSIPGVLMKADEAGRGAPLAGLAVKVTNNYFLIGLSAAEIEVQHNLEMLKQRDWFDVPLVYTSGKRAILSLEKGTPGQRAFEEAFHTWGQ
jgi:hypothetical protein